ncbi:MAG: sulfatase [Planctomycetota bacterium]
MKCVMLMFDSLNRHLLPPYNPQTWVHTPNFRRLAERAAAFDSSYVCSMPCMPARRDFHTARPHFLHTGWGPLEPFDDSVPQMLGDAGVYTHLCTDHYHYWEDGGATYHNRYQSYQFARGQESDAYIGQAREPETPDALGQVRRPHEVNRPHLTPDAKHSQTVTFRDGLDFIDRNAGDDRWFLQVECFDPHEPFFVDRRFRDLYPDDPVGMPRYEWPVYGKVQDTAEQAEAARRNYAALMSKCDASLGDVLDAFDRHDLWDDTMLILWTDHGFMLGEHGWWAKNTPPLYDEIAHTPFFVWDPRCPDAAGQRRKSLVQPAIDLGPTLLNFFGLEPTDDMLGRDLAGVVADDTPVRDAAIFGYFNAAVNYVDDHHVYLRVPRVEGDGLVHDHTLMPTKMRGFKETGNAELVGPLSFTKGSQVLALPQRSHRLDYDDLIFDRAADPKQETPIDDPDLAERLAGRMAELMHAGDAPAGQYGRMGLTPPTQA